ncbi:MAG: carboxymuconolactone decarboxylase family protein [Nitriliruptorales bacterium]|nr:carboxymuconolactone decarboxylase family protein [Nitriliruptorales bacterium]
MRMPLADPERSAAAARVATLVSRKRWGVISALYGMLLHSPTVAEGWLALGTVVRRETGFDDRTRELVTCLVAAIVGASFEWENHAVLARRAGVTDEELDALPDWRTCARFGPRDRALLAFSEAVARGTMDDATFAVARATLREEEVVELAAMVSYYVGTGRFLNALGVEAGASGLTWTPPEQG